MKAIFTRSLLFLVILLPIIVCVEHGGGGVGAEEAENPYDHLVCRDPSFGGGHHNIKQRKFLVISGIGGGIGNYLIFFPAVYYFAALTGRDILILDNSLIGELCEVIHCGFARYSEAAEVFPSLLPRGAEGVRTVKAYDFSNHVWRGALIEERVVIASGYQYKSGWFGENEFANLCVDRLTGCPSGDVSCQDRYALERLVVGPFHSRFRDEKMKDFYHIAGIPKNLRHGMMSLPHSLAPRIDAAVHLRCQFSHFEWVVGPEDNQWADYVKEVDDFINSTAFNAGPQLFSLIERKIVEQVVEIRKLRSHSNRERSRRIRRGIRRMRRKRRALRHRDLKQDEKEVGNEEEEGVVFHKLSFDEKVEKEEFHGDGDSDRIFVYLSSDNDRVKEAFVKYLEDHDKIAVIRVKTDSLIYHAKHVSHLSQNASIGAFNLATDWYALSLANVMFAWRRDASMLSTFAQSAACFSGNSEEVEIAIATKSKNGSLSIDRNKHFGEERERGFQLITKNSAAWREF